MLPGGRTAVLVGDIAGHGRDVVPLTALVRDDVRASQGGPVAARGPARRGERARRASRRPPGHDRGRGLRSRQRPPDVLVAGHAPPLILLPARARRTPSRPPRSARRRRSASAPQPVGARRQSRSRPARSPARTPTGSTSRRCATAASGNKASARSWRRSARRMTPTSSSRASCAAAIASPTTWRPTSSPPCRAPHALVAASRGARDRRRHAQRRLGTAPSVRLWRGRPTHRQGSA